MTMLFGVSNFARTIEEIRGFTDDEMLSRLTMWARDKDIVVELGSWLGKSSAALAMSCSGLVYCIDIWHNETYSRVSFDDGDGFETSQDNCLAYRIFLANMTHLDLMHKIVPMIASSHDTDKYFKPKSVSMLYLDADHAEHMVLKDLQLWIPKCRDDAIICGDDYNMPTVQRPVDAMAMMNGWRVETFDSGKGWKYTK